MPNAEPFAKVGDWKVYVTETPDGLVRVTVTMIDGFELHQVKLGEFATSAEAFYKAAEAVADRATFWMAVAS